MEDMINGYGPEGSYLSIVKTDPSSVQVIVGANYKNNCASYFSKSGLLKLIETLQKVADDLN